MVEATGTVAVLNTLSAAVPDVLSNVGLAAMVGVGVGLTVFGFKKVWRTFKSM